jgi:hypothetical protein
MHRANARVSEPLSNRTPPPRPCCRSDTAFKIVRLPGTNRGLIKTLLTWDILSLITIGCALFSTILAARMSKGGERGFGNELLGEMPEGLWIVRVMLFWGRVLYMSFSFPWLILKVPGVVKVLTHAQQTGYTRQGVCIRHSSPKIPWSERYKVRTSQAPPPPY